MPTHLHTAHSICVSYHCHFTSDARPFILYWEVPNFQRLICGTTNQAISQQMKTSHCARVANQSHDWPRTIRSNVPNCKKKSENDRLHSKLKCGLIFFLPLMVLSWEPDTMRVSSNCTHDTPWVCPSKVRTWHWPLSQLRWRRNRSAKTCERTKLKWCFPSYKKWI